MKYRTRNYGAGNQKQALTDGHADDLPLSAEDDELLEENNRTHVRHLDVQKIIESTLLRYEENTLKRLSDGISQNIKKILFQTPAKEATKRSASVIYEAAKNIVEQNVDRGRADSAISSRRDSRTKSQEFA